MANKGKTSPRDLREICETSCDEWGNEYLKCLEEKIFLVESPIADSRVGQCVRGDG